MPAQQGAKMSEPMNSPSRPIHPRARRIYLLLWIVLKNVIGWALILAAPPIGLVAPGPMGLPLFLIGFAMVTFPGKRALTSRVMRGKPLERNTPRRLVGEMLLALLLPALLIRVYAIPFSLETARHGPTMVYTVYILAAIASWIVIRLGGRAMNYGLTFVPPLRRKIRPWMRRHGINLLPPRRRRRQRAIMQESEIISVDSRYQRGARNMWKRFQPWVRRMTTLLFLAAIFFWMARKILRHWSEVRGRAESMSPAVFFLAAAMFALFLFAVRSLSWRWILAGLGYRLPIAPAARIWSTSELARYIPGVIWQVWGRAYLALPYGVSKTVCAASQILELIIFLLANILVGIICLAIFGLRNVHDRAHDWLIYLGVLAPLLVLLLHPRIFYAVFDWVLRRMGRPPQARRLSGGELFGLLGWAMLGLLWQNLAVFLIVAPPLGLHWGKWYVVTGSYSLAWCAGFLVVFSPAGIGVREPVFMIAMHLALPKYVRDQFSTQGRWTASYFFWVRCCASGRSWAK